MNAQNKRLLYFKFIGKTQMAAYNDRLVPAPDEPQLTEVSTSWFSEVIVLRIVRLILVVSILAILRMSPAVAQIGSATETAVSVASPGNDFGSLYYLGTFSSAKDLVPHSGICGAFGLVGRPPVRLPEVSQKAAPSHCDTVIDVVAGSRDFGPDEMLSLPYRIISDSKDRVIVADRAIYPSIPSSSKLTPLW